MKNKWNLIAQKRLKSNQKYFYVENLTTIFTELTQANPKSTIVDFGCCDGQDIIELAKSINANFTGYDISDIAIANGIRNITLVGLQDKITLYTLDVNKLSSIENKKYDFGLCKYVLSFIDDKYKFLQEIQRIVKKTFILIVPTRKLDTEGLSEHTLGISITDKELDHLLNEIFPKKYELLRTFSFSTRKYQIKLIKIKME